MAAYKTSAQDAAALATRWYQQGLGRAPDAAGLQHWIGEIQKDGSNTAWQNFSSSPEAQQTGAAGKFAAAKVNPIELTPGAGQLPGTAYGAVVLHVAPEAAAGGPLGLVRTGDRIRLSVAGRSLDLLVDEAELARRKAEWGSRQALTPPPTRGYAKLYMDNVLQADQGCDFGFLRHT